MRRVIDWGDYSTLSIIEEVEKSIDEIIDNKGMARMLTVYSLDWMLISNMGSV